MYALRHMPYNIYIYIFEYFFVYKAVLNLTAVWRLFNKWSSALVASLFLRHFLHVRRYAFLVVETFSKQTIKFPLCVTFVLDYLHCRRFLRHFQFWGLLYQGISHRWHDTETNDRLPRPQSCQQAVQCHKHLRLDLQRPTNSTNPVPIFRPTLPHPIFVLVLQRTTSSRLGWIC